MELMFGGVSRNTLNQWFHMILHYIYTNDPLLLRSRNLSNPVNLKALFEELHAITLRNTRFTSSFTPTMQEAMRRNPQLGNLKLVGICWDSRHIKTQHPIDFKFQRRSYSTKIHNNAIVVLSACGLDAIEKFVYLTAASVSPANTDEALASFIIDLETDYGKYYLHYYFIVSLINRPTAK